MMLKAPLTDTPAIVTNVEEFLERQYNDRHVQSVLVVKQRTWFDSASVWLRKSLAGLSELLIRMEK